MSHNRKGRLVFFPYRFAGGPPRNFRDQIEILMGSEIRCGCGGPLEHILHTHPEILDDDPEFKWFKKNRPRYLKELGPPPTPAK